MTGFFVSIEGVEGVGKSSNHAFVCDYFRERGCDVLATREPGGTPEAEKIRQVLLDASNQLQPLTEALLMFASRAEHLNSVIVPALAAGKVVVSDRFVDASYAYQGGARQLGAELIGQLDSIVVGNCQPDLTLLLDLDIETGFARLDKRGVRDRIELEEQAFFTAARDAYLERATRFPERFRIIDASVSLESVQSSIKETLDALDIAVIP